MTAEIETLRKKILTLVGEIGSAQWVDAEIWFDFPPFINRGLKGTFLFKDTEGKILPIFLPFDMDLQNLLYNFIIQFNKDGQYNRLTFAIDREKKENATLQLSFNQQVDDAFQSNIPKSKEVNTSPGGKTPLSLKDYPQASEITMVVTSY